jgi:ERCC4-type nuclease
MTQTSTKHVGTQQRRIGKADSAARRLPAELRPEQVVAVVDSREQLPLDLSPLQSVAGTLTTGDYSVQGLETIVAVERKSLADLLGCIGQHRERFDREVMRLIAYPVRAIVIEATWADLERGEWQSRITPAAAIGSLLGWIAQGVPIILAGDHERAGRYVSRLLFTAARRRWREARALAAGMTNEAHPAEEGGPWARG